MTKSAKMRLITALMLVGLIGMIGGTVYGADFDKGWKAYVAGDYAVAMEEWRPLTKQGDAKAQYFTGLLYNFGKGVTRSYDKAYEWWLKASDQGEANAKFNLGLLYARGWGVPRNEAKAVDLYIEVAEQNHVPVQAGHPQKPRFCPP